MWKTFLLVFFHDFRYLIKKNRNESKKLMPMAYELSGLFTSYILKFNTPRFVDRLSPLLPACSIHCMITAGQFQWLRGLRRRSAAARLLRLWVWAPPGSWKSACCECCVLSGLCDELITRPEESYPLWFVIMCVLESSWMTKLVSTDQYYTVIKPGLKSNQ
jgi:hypothetical protein